MNRSAPVVRISGKGNRIVEIIHRESDPGMWIVRCRKQSFFWTTVVSSDWFNDERQALEFARGLGDG